MIVCFNLVFRDCLMCIPVSFPAPTLPGDYSPPPPHQNSTASSSGSKQILGLKIWIFITICAGAGALLLLTVCLACCCWRRRRNRRKSFRLQGSPSLLSSEINLGLRHEIKSRTDDRSCGSKFIVVYVSVPLDLLNFNQYTNGPLFAAH